MICMLMQTVYLLGNLSCVTGMVVSSPTKPSQTTTGTSANGPAASPPPPPNSNSNPNPLNNEKEPHDTDKVSLRRTSPLLDEWREFEVLRDCNLEKEVLTPFFENRQWLLVQRIAKISLTLYNTKKDWLDAGTGTGTGSETSGDGSGAGEQKADEAGSYMNEETQNEIDRATKLCEAIASLGPVAVKLGQTMSQRPDIVGVDVCKALKRLQTNNVPFEDKLAFAILRESLDFWDGPLAANLPVEVEMNMTSTSIDGTAYNYTGEPLFAEMTSTPIACASLGQVYKATMHNGTEIALKIQRPDALATLAMDAQCYRIVYKGLCEFRTLQSKFDPNRDDGFSENELRGENQTVAYVIDRVARDIKREIDYNVEAAAGYKFRESLAFLGFVTTPEVIQCTDKILMTGWIPGNHLENLSPSQGLAMTRMAVEACTASMVLTGFVHADPHEGNLMLHEDGRIVFLDFGLMSNVDQDIMEAFARGIQALLSEDWVSLTEAFVDTGFVTSPIMHRNGTSDVWRQDPAFGIDELAIDMEKSMKTTEGGLSRFGALATVLNKKISPNWLVFTPPYVLLLIRTFLTLEGIAAQVDPEFNIYEMSLPWVVRRSLSPSTKKGVEVFRSTILTSDNRIQWERLIEMANVGKDDDESASTSTSAPGGVSHTRTEVSDEVEVKKREQAAAKQAAMKDAIGTLLGSTNGKALRRTLRDLDARDLIWKLGSRDGRPLLEMAVKKAIGGDGDSEREAEGKVTADPEHYRVVSDESKLILERQARRTKQVARVLILGHIRNCLSQFYGLVAMARLLCASVRIAAPPLAQRIMLKAKAKFFGRFFNSSKKAI